MSEHTTIRPDANGIYPAGAFAFPACRPMSHEPRLSLRCLWPYSNEGMREYMRDLLVKAGMPLKDGPRDPDDILIAYDRLRPVPTLAD